MPVETPRKTAARCSLVAHTQRALAHPLEAVGVGGVGPRVRLDVRDRDVARERVAAQVVVQPALARLAPAQAVLVGVLEVLARLADVEPPALRVRAVGRDDAGIDPEAVADVVVDEPEPEADVHVASVTRQAEVAAEVPVGDVVDARRVRRPEVERHPVRLAMVEGREHALARREGRQRGSPFRLASRRGRRAGAERRTAAGAGGTRC